MPTQTARMTGAEFAGKVPSGERVYRGLVLEEGFDLSGYEGFQNMQDYLKGQNLKEYPLDLRGTTWKRVRARGLYLPFVEAEKADLEGANLGRANLMEANLEGANLGRANLEGANLEGANLMEANLVEAYLWRANLMEAYLWRANLWRANLKDVRNLDAASNLGYATFFDTRVTEAEQRICQGASDNRRLFVVVE